MKTHELAKSLNILSRLLLNGPNVYLDELEEMSSYVSAEKRRNATLKGNEGAALALLANLASYTKTQWVEIINEFGLDVPIKKTDSTRDLLGRILKHLNDNQTAKDKLVQGVQRGKANVSPELMKALSILMNR